MVSVMQNKFCNKNDLTNEATVEQFLLSRLFEYLNFKDKDIKPKTSLKELVISRGSKKVNYKPDYVLFVNKKPKVVIDAKDPDEDVDDFFYQVSGYALGLNQEFQNETPVEFTILANGSVFKLYRWDKNNPILTLDFGDFIDGNSKFERLIELISYKKLKTKPSVRQAVSSEFEFRKPTSNDQIEAIFRACHQIIWDKDNMKPADAFPEFAKLFFIKIHYDRKIHDIINKGNIPDINDYIFSINWIDKQKRELNDNNPVANILFKQLREDLEDQIDKKKKKRIFDKNEELNISAPTIKEVVKLLEHYDLFGIDEDLNGRMFESFLSATVRGKDLGQFFTPRTVVKFMTEIAHLKANNDKIDYVLDGFCGSGGFLIEAMGNMINKIKNNRSLSDKEQDDLRDKVVGECLYGIDADKSPKFKISRIARMNMVMHGDGNNRIYWLPDTLDKAIKIETDNKELREEAKELKEKLEGGLIFDVVLTNPPFSRGYNPKKTADLEKLKDYDIAKKEETEQLKAIKSNVLSLERYRDLLKPHGKLLTVIDESVLNSYSGREYRKFIRKNFLLKAIISLPQNSFTNAEANVKTSILYLIRKRKIKKDSESESEDDEEDETQPDIFMGVCENIGHTDSGKSDLENLTLLRVYDYNKKLINLRVPTTILEKFFEYEETGKLEKQDDFAFIIKGSEIEDRFDPYNHQPSYKKLIKNLKELESQGKITLEKGDKFNIVNQMSKVEVKSNETKMFKYIDIGNTEKDLGQIKGHEEDILLNLPTRARMVIKENDILIPAPVHSASGIVIVPKEYDGQLCSTGFIVIRPKDLEETILLYAILKSETVQKQFFHLQSGINQQSITNDNFKKFVLLPMPKQPSVRKEMIEKIGQLRISATQLKKEYNQKLSEIQGEFIKVIGN